MPTPTDSSRTSESAINEQQALREAADAFYPNDLKTFVRLARRSSFSSAGVGTQQENDVIFVELRRKTALAEAILAVLGETA